MSNALPLTPVDQQRELLAFIRAQYPALDSIPLHSPVFGEEEKHYLSQCIDSDYVSSVGPAIAKFEQQIAEAAQANFAVALVNGTAALQLALQVSGVSPGTEVITQAFTFVGTANAISHCNAEPIFIDIDNHLGLCPQALRRWLQDNTCLESRHKQHKQHKQCYNLHTGKRIAACVPMHCFGHPVQLQALLEVCEEFYLPLVEDAAEAFGSRYQEKAVGALGKCGVFSFNGNKIITTGGGGAVVTNDESIARHIRHLATTAKQAHPWHFYHDEIGYNYRLPNLNASLGLAQMQRLPSLLKAKRKLAEDYRTFLMHSDWQWLEEPAHCQSNYWLNALLCGSQQERDRLLQMAHDQDVQLRPSWQPLHQSKPYQHCQHDSLSLTEDITSRMVNIPSGVMGSLYA